jgi:hypothetical protein
MLGKIPIALLYDTNTVINETHSGNFKLSKDDALPDLEFNVVPWHANKGDNVPFPGPRRAAFAKLKEDEKDEDYINMDS